MFDSLRCCDVDSLQKQRSDFINAELTRYLKNTFFKNYNFVCEFSGMNVYSYKYYTPMIRLLMKFNFNSSCQVNVEINFTGPGTELLNDIRYELSELTSMFPSLRLKFRNTISTIVDAPPFKEMMIFDYQTLPFYPQLLDLFKNLHDNNFYDTFTNKVKRKYNKIYYTNYYTHLKNIILILCQAKYNRAKFPLPYDIVKIIARKLMN